MTDFFVGLFPMLFTYYLMYFIHFFYSLIPIFIQIIFLKFLKVENLKVICIIIFLVEGILIAFSNVIIKILINADYSTFAILTSMFCMLIVIVISCILGRIAGKINFRKTLIILLSFILNIIILAVLILKLNVFFFF